MWLYATVDCVDIACALERPCEEHDACRWLAGGRGRGEPPHQRNLAVELLRKSC